MSQAPASTHLDPQGLSPAGSSRTAVARAARLAGAALLAAASTLTAQAQSLAELYDSARGHDAGYQSARAQYEANLAKAAQARAGVLPTASLTAAASRGQIDLTTTPPANTPNPREYGTQSAALNVTQPLYRPANLASYRQGEQQLLLAEEQLKAAEQDLIVRVAQGYFDLLGAQDSLNFVKAQKTAVARTPQTLPPPSAAQPARKPSGTRDSGTPSIRKKYASTITGSASSAVARTARSRSACSRGRTNSRIMQRPRTVLPTISPASRSGPRLRT